MKRNRVNRKTKVAHRMPGCCERAERIAVGNYVDTVEVPSGARRCRLCNN